MINLLLLIFQNIFPEYDRSCKNMDRMFFGGKELIFFDGEARLALVQLIHPLLESFDTGNHFKENIRKFANKTNVLLVDGHLAMGKLEDRDAVLGEKMDSPVIHITGKSQKSPFFAVEGYMHQSHTCKVREKKKMNIGSGETCCQLYNDFKEGKDSGHNAKFAIITNFLSINGGRKDFLNTIRRFYGEEAYEKWEKDIKYLKGYHPKRCSGEFCPYYEKCEHAGTIVDTLAMDRKVYRDKETYVSVREAERCMEESLNDAFQSSNDGIYLIKAQTGLGKTGAYVELIANNPGHRFLIALPTNILKEEVYNHRLSWMPEKDRFMTESIHGNSFFPQEIQDRIAAAHACGIHNQTAKIIGEYYNSIKNDPDRLAVKETCERVLEGIAAVTDERVVVTTHAYLLLLPEEFLKKYTVIIDEDILQLQAFNRMNSVSIRCLMEVAERGFPAYSGIASELLRSKEGEYRKTGCWGYCPPLVERQLEELQCFGANENVNDLACAGSYVRMKSRDDGEDIIRYFCPLELPPMKYIILSATLNENIYREYFQGKMEVYSYHEKKAAYTGRLQQYTYHSLGRRDLSDKLQVFSIARDMGKSRDMEIISFKKFENMEGIGRLNSAGIHFGNSTGVNSLKGRDLAVIGTPYSVDENYKLVACYLGADVNQKEDTRPGFRRVAYKGCSFLITTYRNPLLQEVQLYSIESELEQCIGRARLLRSDCDVYVFSSFPCEQAELHTRNYL